MQVWFDKDIFKGIDDDECLEDADVEAAITAIKKKGGKILEKQPAAATGQSGKKRAREEESGYTSDEDDGDDDDDESDSDSDYDVEQMKPSTAKPTGNEMTQVAQKWVILFNSGALVSLNCMI